MSNEKAAIFDEFLDTLSPEERVYYEALVLQLRDNVKATAEIKGHTAQPFGIAASKELLVALAEWSGTV